MADPWEPFDRRAFWIWRVHILAASLARFAFYLGIVLAAIAAYALLGFALTELAQEITGGYELAPCATEDAVGACYWDAEAQGNGEGRSFTVDKLGYVTYTD